MNTPPVHISPTSPQIQSWEETMDQNECAECEKRQKQVEDLVAVLDEITGAPINQWLSYNAPYLYQKARALIVLVEVGGPKATVKR